MENRTTGFLIAYKVKECEDRIKGLGVFAQQDIAKGTTIWRPTGLIEKLSVEEAAILILEKNGDLVLYKYRELRLIRNNVGLNHEIIEVSGDKI